MVSRHLLFTTEEYMEFMQSKKVPADIQEARKKRLHKFVNNDN